MKNNSKLKTKQSGKTNKRKKGLAKPSLGILSQTVQHSLLLVRFFQQPAKTSVSPRSPSLGTFRAEERVRLSDRNSMLMTQINVYIINPVVMGFQI